MSLWSSVCRGLSLSQACVRAGGRPARGVLHANTGTAPVVHRVYRAAEYNVIVVTLLILTYFHKIQEPKMLHCRYRLNCEIWRVGVIRQLIVNHNQTIDCYTIADPTTLTPSLIIQGRPMFHCRLRVNGES